MLYLATGGFVLAGTMAPFTFLVVDGLFSPARPSGFGQDGATLLVLARRSLFLAVAPAMLATLLAMAASSLASLYAPFRTFYRRWFYTVLFTNPVFLVLGMTVLLNRLPSELAVTLASWLVLMPLVALPIQAAVDQAPATELLAARSLGASSAELVRLHLIPAIGSTAIAAFGLATVFALGFYLLPTFVGYGHTPTLGSAIDAAVNRLGDNKAAAQLGILLVGLEVCLCAAILMLVAVRAMLHRAR
ncbi:MAG: ABC transporter permease subunit [Pseudomonadota bacterium]|nr:ABC transporter permease subunit [Pseudomonadota bacterium]